MDEHWKISCETAIKARSVTGYATCNRKMILNKFLEGDPKVCRAGITGWTHRIWSLNFLLKGLNQVM